MKRLGFIVLVMVMLQMLASCVSLNDREMSLQERAYADVIGSVTVTFNSFQVFNIHNKNRIKQKAYRELLKIARQDYQGDIDIRNITITSDWSNLQLLNIIGYALGTFGTVFGYAIATYPDQHNPEFWGMTAAGLGVMGLSGNTQKITATGDVVLLRGGTKSEASLIENALEIMNTLIDNDGVIYNKNVLEDFQLIDLDLLSSAINALPFKYH